MSARSQEQVAVEVLNHPQTYPALEAWPERELIFRIWRHPALDAYTSWLLRETNKTFYVRRLEWDRRFDCRCPQQEPTIYGSESILPTERAILLLDKLRTISLTPFVSTPSIGIDGVIYGVETKGFYLKTKLSWWCSPPESWNELATWFNEAVELFNSILPDGAARMPY